MIESFYQWHKLLVRMRDVDKQYDEAARNIERRLKEFDEIETKAKPKPK